ncbi:carbohydrate ABC transporter membrane protein 1 (CUT1 family) [Rhodovulum imhoffii]|uniref:Carbohydrate ABC transporter membrane protein 1 (CUT1 family) n=1 Tax=Rhodovulum imhoffii TaxID=365340 RepID=A0A2T5BP06_9RHOB|nr:sugar ABC transporter permease [Rhodovulum imhoffii]MBK5933629.1 sugar ABC transporter permease [Rhodovulum imhoffii]PTN00712.1 carbohydrate ABC transporter membrane protein 1 (CUT1 family) [Rhodovulum imhoffii]
MAYIRKRNRRIFGMFLLPAILVLFLTTIYPMIYAGYLSFRSYDLAKIFVPRVFVGGANYREILSSSEFLHSLIVTFKLMAMTLSVQLVLGVGIALLVVQKLPGMPLARTLLMIPMMISPVIVGLVWLFLYFPEIGYLNYFLSFAGVGSIPWIASTNWALWAIAIADIWQWTPFVMMGTAAALQSLSPEPYEAAMIDGNSRWDIFTRVTLPQLKPVLVSLMFLRAIDAFKIYDIIFVLTKGGPGDSTEVLSMFIYRQSFTFWRMGVGAAASFVSLIIIVVLITLFFKSLNRDQAA